MSGRKPRMATSTMPAPSSPAPPTFAGWWSRVRASTLDAIFVTLIDVVLTVVLILIGMSTDAANWAFVVLTIGYFTLGHGGATGQTWGKRVVGIRVLRDGSYERLGYARSFIRCITAIGLTFLLLLPNVLDVLWPLWDSKRQALRDKVAGSVVLRG